MLGHLRRRKHLLARRQVGSNGARLPWTGAGRDENAPAAPAVGAFILAAGGRGAGRRRIPQPRAWPSMRPSSSIRADQSSANVITPCAMDSASRPALSHTSSGEPPGRHWSSQSLVIA